MHAYSIKPAEVNVNSEMIASVNSLFSRYKTNFFNKTDEEDKKHFK